MNFKKAFLLFFISILAFLLISYFLIYEFSKSSFLSLEIEEAKNAVKKVEFYFQEKLNELHGITKDWAAWDDAYLFMQNKKPDFLSSNIIPETYLNLKIDLLLYTYLDGKFKAGGLFDKEKQKIYIDKELISFITSIFETFSKKNLNNYKKLVIFMDKPFLITVYPVLKSDFTGPPQGYLFMGRFLTQKDIDAIKIFFDIKSLQIFKSDNPLPEFKLIKADLDEIILEKNWFLNNENLKIRLVYLVEKSIINSLILFTAGAQIFLLLIFGIIFSFFIDKFILKSLLNLLKEINQVKNREKTKLSLEYNLEEFKNLAETINKFLEDISIRENIYKAIAEKTENLILLFNKDKNILFQNINITKYFNSEELNLLVSKILDRIKNLNSSRGLFEIKEFFIKNHWFNLQIIKISENLYLLVGQNITEVKSKEEALFKMATHDFLTNLYNRRYLEDVLGRVIAASKRGEKFVLLFIDCNDLKQINDSYGHLIGDEVLKIIAKAIKESIRKEDIAARWGGDEFVVILNHCDKNMGINIAQRIINHLESSEIKVNSTKIKPSISIGLVEIDGTKRSDEFFDLADKLTYKSKKTGKIEYEL